MAFQEQATIRINGTKYRVESRVSGGALLVRYPVKGRWRRESLGTRNLMEAIIKVFGRYGNKDVDLSIDVSPLLGLAPFGQPSSPRPSLMELARSHPVAQRMAKRGRPGDLEAVLIGVREFIIDFGDDPSKLTSSNIAAYLESDCCTHLAKKTKGDRIKGLKWAAAMWSERSGQPDHLSGKSLVRDDGPPKRKDFSHLPSFADCFDWAVAHRGTAASRAVLLGLLGLRSSEIQRAKFCDIVDGRLDVGVRAAKNSASRRSLPLPESFVPLLGTGEGFIVPRLRGGQHDRSSLPAAVAGVGFTLVKVGDLREVCANALSRADVQGKLLEAWLGHARTDISKVSARHYVAQLDGAELLPVAQVIQGLVGARPEGA